jgi:hypothetical protein
MTSETNAAEILDDRPQVTPEDLRRLDAEDAEWLAEFTPALRLIQQSL